MINRIKFQEFTEQSYPFTVPSIRSLEELIIDPKITIFVGDNGSGKSTLLIAIAYYNNSINVSKHTSSSSYFNDALRLSKKMKIEYRVKTRNGFYFSGEDFITYINNLQAMKEQLLQDKKEMEVEFKGKSDYSKMLALGPINKSLYELNETYNGELQNRSHGEGFLDFFKARMHKKGIYILDEPETPLSPINQYQLVVLITDLVRSGSQVIIATHSPILMALKDATIYHFDTNSVKQIQYEEIESVMFLKHFLNDKDNFINRI